MKNWKAFRFRTDSPQFVVAHGELQRQKGKNPSVPFGAIRNPRLALARALQILADRARNQKVAEEAIWALASAMKKEWRIDQRKDEQPSANFNVIHAEDIVRRRDLFTLHIAHVNSFHGKGFKPILRHLNAACETGEVYLGTTEGPYERAVEEGERILWRNVAKLEADMKQQDLLEARLHRPRRQKGRKGT